MSATYVVRDVGGLWVMDCCDDIHGLQEVVYEAFPTRTEAENAATAHRADDRRDKAARDARLAQCCPTCGVAR